MLLRATFVILLGMACSTLAIAQDVDKKLECSEQKPPKKGKGVAVRHDCARLEGNFDGGEMFGQGRLTYPDGRVMEGSFQRGRMVGKGVATWPDGRRYEGFFYDGRSDGLGVYATGDGTVYEGKFKPGAKLHGWGTRRNPDGNTLVGEFRDGYPFGEMLLVKPDGSQEVVAFAYGPSPLDEYNDVVRQGDALYATGNYSDAVRMYERARRIAYNNKLKTDSAALEDRLAKAKKARK